MSGDRCVINRRDTDLRASAVSDDSKPSVLVVDDTPLNLQVATEVLRREYQALAATDGPKALGLLARRPDVALILMDVMMPVMDGYEVCRRVKENPLTAHIPVIFLTALSSAEDEQRAFEAGGVDFITKPFQPDTMMARVGTHVRLAGHERQLDALVRERTESLEARTAEHTATRLQLIGQLGRVAEFREEPTGTHVLRMSHYAGLLARAAGLSEEQGDLILEASAMHDVGMVGVPDAIVLKPGPLSAEEAAQFEQHTVIGAQIIGTRPSGLLACARRIALSHHERYDGSGYPQGLAGDAIPIEARIAAIADAFDGLTAPRAGGGAASVDDAVRVMIAGAGAQFDPELIASFVEHLPEMLEIRERLGEDVDAAAASAESAGLAAMRAFRADSPA